MSVAYAEYLKIKDLGTVISRRTFTRRFNEWSKKPKQLDPNNGSTTADFIDLNEPMVGYPYFDPKGQKFIKNINSMVEVFDDSVDSIVKLKKTFSVDEINFIYEVMGKILINTYNVEEGFLILKNNRFF